jgi:hypothetical protein
MAVKRKGGYRYGKAGGDVVEETQRLQNAAALRRISRQIHRFMNTGWDQNPQYMEYLVGCKNDVMSGRS